MPSELLIGDLEWLASLEGFDRKEFRRGLRAKVCEARITHDLTELGYFISQWKTTQRALCDLHRVPLDIDHNQIVRLSVGRETVDVACATSGAEGLAASFQLMTDEGRQRLVRHLQFPLTNATHLATWLRSTQFDAVEGWSAVRRFLITTSQHTDRGAWSVDYRLSAGRTPPAVGVLAITVEDDPADEP